VPLDFDFFLYDVGVLVCWQVVQKHCSLQWAAG